MILVPPLPEHLDRYEGWQPNPSRPRIVKVDNTISKEDMWTHFISKRRPVVIDGLLQDPDFKANKWTNLDYLRATAGEVPVKIEPVHPSAGHFGTSVKRKKVKFAEFLDILDDTDSAGKWYLTTQYVEEGEQDQSPQPSTSANGSDSDSEDSDYEPELDNVLPAPTNALSNDFPAKPEIFGNLVLQQCNLWLGNSKQGKSSGLHHDFHDNLYILLSGYKRFLLFPPSAHRYLHPRGFVDRVYQNGLIVYAPPGQAPAYMPGRRPKLPIRPDGLVPSDAARWRRKARLRVKQEIDERAAADAGEGSRHKSQRKGKAKQTRAQELAEEALLQAEAELRICRLDEEGIDPEANTSEEEGEEYEEESSADIDGLLSEVESDDSDEDERARRLIASLPGEMKQVALAAFAGDLASAAKVRAYLADDAVTDDEEDELESDPGEQSEEEVEPQEKNGLSGSDVDDESQAGTDDESRSGDESEELDEPDAVKIIPSNGLSRKRKEISVSDQADPSDEEHLDESDTVESDTSEAPAKRVKISSRIESIEAKQQSEAGSGEEGELSEGQDSSEEEGDPDEPGFPPADSGSEFGDVDEGEAELEKLLALAQAEEDEEPADESNEPPSFSRIPPDILHRYLRIPDDFSRPTNGSAPARTSNGEQYLPLCGCPAPIEVFLKPGQMLYLPASWYHEVTSSSLPPPHEQEEAQAGSEVHMALNYWFHPPDALEFVPVPRQARASNDVGVPGVGVALGEGAVENRGSGTGTCERPYRDAEVWDEVARGVEEQIRLARRECGRK